MQYGFFFDETRCIDCRACSVACRDWNDIPAGPIKWLRHYTWETGSFPNTRLRFLFAPCFHCEIPLCLEACPNNAIFKEDKYGAVLVDEQLCQGAHACWDACPYGVPQFADDQPGTKMTKCTLCIDRLEQGEMPVCVLSCPTRALDFGPIDELRAKYGQIAQIEGMPDPSETQPSVVFKSKMPRRELPLPYDAYKALRLFAQRDPQPPIYDDLVDLVEPLPGMRTKDHLVMKVASREATLELTKNDEG